MNYTPFVNGWLWSRRSVQTILSPFESLKITAHGGMGLSPFESLKITIHGGLDLKENAQPIKLIQSCNEWDVIVFNCCSYDSSLLFLYNYVPVIV